MWSESETEVVGTVVGIHMHLRYFHLVGCSCCYMERRGRRRRTRRRGEGCWVQFLATLGPLISGSLWTLRRGLPWLLVDLLEGEEEKRRKEERVGFKT